MGDDMRVLIRTAAATAGVAAGLFLVPAAGAVTAAHQAARLPEPGTTTITTSDTTPSHSVEGIANTLIFSGIELIATAPAGQTLLHSLHLFHDPSGFSSLFRLTFPVTSGAVPRGTLGGKISHAGSIFFVDQEGLIQVSHLTMDVKHKVLTATIIPDRGFRPRRVIVFRLDLSHARIRQGDRRIRASGIGLRFTAVAAAALDRSLSTKIFTPGLKFGTASTVLPTCRC
jgi:hypothetical protein